MQKEIFWAILVGFLIGLAITFGLWRANEAVRTSAESSPAKISPETNETTLSPEKTNPALVILSPSDNFLSRESKVTLKGSYQPQAQIVVLSEKSEKVIKTDEKGNFETEVLLITGENVIEINGFTVNGDEDKKTITVVYSTVEF